MHRDEGVHGVEVVDASLCAACHQDRVFYVQGDLYLSCEVHVDVEGDSEHAKLGDCLFLGVADSQIDPVYFEVDDNFFEYFDAFHGLHLLFFVQELLHHLLALLGVAHLSDFLHFLIEPHAVDHFIVDVLEHGHGHFCQDGKEGGVLGGGEFFLFGELGDDGAVGLLPVLVEGVALASIFDDVEAVVVEVLYAVEDLAQLPAVHLDVDAVDHHIHVHHVPHV